MHKLYTPIISVIPTVIFKRCLCVHAKTLVGTQFATAYRTKRGNDYTYKQTTKRRNAHAGDHQRRNLKWMIVG